MSVLAIICTNMRFDQQVNLCHKDTSDISIVYPVNLALTTIFNESQLTEILATRLLKNQFLSKLRLLGYMNTKCQNVLLKLKKHH